MRKLLTIAGLAAAVLALAACASSSGSSSAAPSSAPAAPSSAPAAGASSGAAASSSGSALTSRTIGGAQVVTNSAGFTLYWFAPDTSTTSMCNGSCATYWPPVKGPATAGSGVTGTLGVITRSGGTMQASYDGHPLYTYAGDSAPGQNKGNGLNLSGGLWHEVTVSGAVAAASTSTGSASTSTSTSTGSAGTGSASTSTGSAGTGSGGTGSGGMGSAGMGYGY
jgi:predicted lipoprotein with Yx(FWY)xxD motif